LRGATGDCHLGKFDDAPAMRAEALIPRPLNAAPTSRPRAIHARSAAEVNRLFTVNRKHRDQGTAPRKSSTSY
jgi:hypothetical protein